MPRVNYKALLIGVIGIDVESPPIKRFNEKGHCVYEVVSMIDPNTDVIIGPRCWRVDPSLGHLDTQLKMMIEGVRNVKYSKEKEDEHGK